jgi:hypothetical protein
LEEICRKKEVDEMKTLTKEFAGLAATKAGPVWTLTDGDGWRQQAVGSNNFISSTYFDLAGMAMNDETLFFEAAGIQEVLNPSAENAVAGDLVTVIDIMCTTPLTDTEVMSYGLGANMKGPYSTLTFDQTVYGRVRTFNMDLDNVAGGYYILLADHQSGSLEPTASDRIYCYRAVSFGTANSDGQHTVFAARYLLRADAKEEPEFEYLMRLKRSYELQNEPDRD